MLLLGSGCYLEHNKREHEITKHISLRMLDPVALIKLKETGVCFLALPERLFDLDYPGHYMRRIKSVGLTIPAVTGPYTNISCTLTLLSNLTRTRPTADSDRDYAWTSGDFEDSRFSYNVGGIQSIATSNAQNDSGLFELNFRDERYFPFEGAGAISNWRLELPNEFRAFDYATIPDVILHIRYMARDGGSVLKQAALESLRKAVSEGPFLQMFSAREQFSSEWHKFLHAQTEKPNELTLDLQRDRFPYFPSNQPLSLNSMKLFLKLKQLDKNVPYDDTNPLTYDLLLLREQVKVQK